MGKLLKDDWALVLGQMSTHVLLTMAMGAAPLNGSVVFSPYSVHDGARVWWGFKRISSDQTADRQG